MIIILCSMGEFIYECLGRYIRYVKKVGKRHYYYKIILGEIWKFIYEYPRRIMRRYLGYSFVAYKNNFIIIDNFEPSSLLTGFRVTEFNFLLNVIPEAKLLTMSSQIYKLSDMQKRIKTKEMQWSVPMDYSTWKTNVSVYVDHFNMDKNQFIYMANRPYKVKLAYIIFLYNAYLSLKFLEKNNIPFIFTLFPGGGFRLNHKFSDKMMEDVFSSPMFRGCFVSQKIIYDYIIDKGFAAENKLYFKYGGLFQFTKADVLPKLWYKKDKETFDICFIAYRYMKKGLDKGFDIALYALKNLIKKYSFIHLHCVGTHTLEDFDDDFSDIKNNIHFYGSRRPQFFPKFFQKMDIALSPNRVNVLDKGAFDGFPLMSEAGFFGVPIFCSDELGLNHNYIDGQDLVIIKPDVFDVCEKIEWYINHLEDLYDIGLCGKNKIQEYFDLETQKKDRLDFISKYFSV